MRNAAPQKAAGGQMKHRTSINLTVLFTVAAYAAFGNTAPAFANTVQQTGPSPEDQAWTVLRQADLRLATIVDRLARANTTLCSPHEAMIGVLVQSLGQYPDSMKVSARAAFGFETPISVEATIAPSPATIAGILPNDGIVAINDRNLSELSQNTTLSVTGRDEAERLLRALPVAKPANIVVKRHGELLHRTVIPAETCQVHSELVTESGFHAASDDQRLQVGIDYLVRFDENELAVIVAHEMAHILLHHSDRLEAAGVRRGVLQEIGRSACTTLEAETQADRFSLWLLAKAGYDPSSGPRYWRGKGRSVSGGIFRSPTHASARQRAKDMDAELAIITQDPTESPRDILARFGGKLGEHCS